MALTKEQEKKLLIVLLVVLAVFIVYRVVTAEKPKTVPLAYPPGTVAASPVRKGIASPTAPADPLVVLLGRRDEKYPGTARDIFRMANPAPKPKTPSRPVPPSTPQPPPVPQKTPEEIAADLARLDLSRFRFLGYLTDKDSTLFLSKDGELYIVRSGDTILKSYRVKESGKDHVILKDSATGVEVRVELTGGVEKPGQPQPGQPPQPGYPQPRFR